MMVQKKGFTDYTILIDQIRLNHNDLITFFSHKARQKIVKNIGMQSVYENWDLCLVSMNILMLRLERLTHTGCIGF